MRYTSLVHTQNAEWLTDPVKSNMDMERGGKQMKNASVAQLISP